MLRAFKIRLYPNKEQEQSINKLLGCYRFVYNHMLALKQKEYDDNKINLSANELSKYFYGKLRKNEEYFWVKEQNTQVMTQSIRQMLTAFDRFLNYIQVFQSLNQRKINYQHYFRLLQFQREIHLNKEK